jgi:hypothetical protein
MGGYRQPRVASHALLVQAAPPAQTSGAAGVQAPA